MPAIRFDAVEAKATNRPFATVVEVHALLMVVVTLPQAESVDCTLGPSAGVVPSGVEISVVTPTQVLVVLVIVVTQVPRSKISDWALGFGAVDPRFVAVEVKETKSPSSEMEGLELSPLPNVTPSGVETRYVAGTQLFVGEVVTIVAMLQVLKM